MPQLRFLVALVTLLSLSGLSGPAPVEAQDRSKQGMIVAFAAEPRTLLPTSSWTGPPTSSREHVRPPGGSRSQELQARAHAGHGWKVVNDTTWEFTLRQGVKFHNGEPFNAASVKATMDYIKDPANKSHYLPRWAQVKEVQVVNDYTVRFITESRGRADRSDSPPTSCRCRRRRSGAGRAGAAAKPIGTGPFKFVQWVRDESWSPRRTLTTGRVHRT